MILPAFCFGLILGSFANVYFHRLPMEKSVVFPPSECPACRAPIRWFDNIPVLSYLILRGRCRACSAKISIQYPLVEIFTGLLFAATAWKFAAAGIPVLIALTAFAYVIFLAGGIDLATYFKFDRQFGIIPDHLTYPLLIGGVAVSPLNPLTGSFAQTLVVSLAVAGFLLAFRWLAGKILKQEALGLGDVKLLAAVAAWLGWRGFVVSLFVGSLLGTVVSMALIALKKISRKSPLPFGPYLAAGILSAFFLA